MSKRRVVSVVEPRSCPSDDTVRHDLPTNNISVVMLRVGGTPGHSSDGVNNDLFTAKAPFRRVRVLRDGNVVFSMTWFELLSLNLFRHGVNPIHRSGTADRIVTVPIFMSRFAYDSTSGLPAGHRGRNQIEFDFGNAADSTLWGGSKTYAVDVVEMPDAKFANGERCVSFSGTTAAADVESRIELPVGRTYRGLLLFSEDHDPDSPTGFAFDNLEIYQDGDLHTYFGCDEAVLRCLPQLHGNNMDPGSHFVNDGAGWQFVHKGSPRGLYLDFDETRDDKGILDAVKSNSLHLRFHPESGSAIDGSAVSVLPVERIKW